MFFSKKQLLPFGHFTLIAAAVFLLCVNFSFAQTAPPIPPVPPVVKPPVKNVWITKRQARNDSGAPAEKSIATDEKVSVSLCVSDGSIKITGWQRNEVRAFIDEGSEVGFKVLENNIQSGKPGWIHVLGYDSSKSAGLDECVFGEDIRLDVPRNAIVNIKSRNSETSVNSVGKVTVENVGGNIFLSNISQGIDAKTHEGDVTIEKSGGAISLSSIVGNILAFDVNPREIGDTLKAKTSNGSIVLQKAAHRQIDVSSNSGSIKFDGKILSGGQYNFQSQNGSILLLIPPDSSSKINATYSFGTFNSEIPMQNLVNPDNIKIRNLSGVIGKGEANVSIRTFSGEIQIKKQ